jgi:hypothetical protein
MTLLVELIIVHNQLIAGPMNTYIVPGVKLSPVIVNNVPPATDPTLGVTDLTKTA